ncbi:ABC transporter ATP-binding protein [Ascidiimonas sp. W6]|uniref:ABC transporter ATP-binding protein n=1 Tax=Ascidiimonas meishanensis TaxID=3128903 RepID=UPI0030ED5326
MLKVENLYYTYAKNDNPTIKGISFEVKPGKIIGFLGPSGAGKSTVQKIIIRLLSGYKGDIEVSGKKLQDWNLKDYYEYIGVGFELPNHYLKLTALENLNLFGSFYSCPIKFDHLLEQVGLAEHKNKRVEEFSKGMKMRLNFVRAFMHDPKLIFLDEPTSGLDPVSARNLKNIIIEQKRKGKTIFLTTHNMYDAEELCDQVGFIVDGELKVMDNPATLKREGFTPKVVLKYKNDESFEKEFDLQGIGQNENFIKTLKNTDYTIESINTKKTTLEDVFIKVTGANLSK